MSSFPNRSGRGLIYDGSIGGGVAVGDTRLFSTGMASEIDPLRCWLSLCKLYNMLGVLIECLGVLLVRTSFLRS